MPGFAGCDPAALQRRIGGSAGGEVAAAVCLRIAPKGARLATFCERMRAFRHAAALENHEDHALFRFASFSLC